MADSGVDTYSRDVLDARHREVQRDLADFNRRLTKLDEFVCGNGKPPLEKRIMAEVAVITSRIERHGNRNMEQVDGDLREDLQRETAAREKQHERNVALLQWIVGIGLTACALMLTVIGLLIGVLKK